MLRRTFLATLGSLISLPTAFAWTHGRPVAGTNVVDDDGTLVIDDNGDQVVVS